MNILICGLQDMRQYHGKVSAVLSVIDHDDVPYVLSLGVTTKRRLILHCDDVDSVADARARERDQPGSRCIAPTEAMVQQALDFAGGLASSDTLLIHCGYGLSRSTAIAYAVLCAAQAGTPEDETFRQMLKIRPQATPNALIVKLADRVLNRGGRMCKALENYTLSSLELS